MPDNVLREDLEKYRRHAIELGAADAVIIISDGVFVDERVRARPNMHAVGMDAFRIATCQGWDVHLVGESTSPSDRLRYSRHCPRLIPHHP